MPTYQYRCTACDHRFEAVQSFSDASLTTCPACSGALRKVFSSVGIVFKGSGFYRTDSRSGSGSTVSRRRLPGQERRGEGRRVEQRTPGPAKVGCGQRLGLVQLVDIHQHPGGRGFLISPPASPGRPDRPSIE